MRASSVAFIVSTLAATGASASSIQSLDPSAGTPSIVALADTAADPSIVDAGPLVGPAPSILALADTPTGETTDILSLGDPALPGEAAAGDADRMTMPLVIRGGETGQISARPAPAPAQATAPDGQPPLLDPNDRGTPAKRKALKRQAERLAQQKAQAPASGQNPDPSDHAVPLGQ
ncbi:hypothetical protein ABUE31_15925 [Mesorhizobium sp. ZMM04-5]|uniref:Uncharacterized protein n=1 Tax=Mesorhizobium marinum TaxID=3228790 RepID=A0ABV3R2D8_9HYPH